MSGLSPSGPDQPNLDDAYKTKGNAASQDPSEKYAAQQNRASAENGEEVESRSANDQSSAEPTSTSLGRGIRGAPSGLEKQGYTQRDVDSGALDADQMAAPGEGDVYNAVEGGGRSGQGQSVRDGGGKPGASGAQPGLESDLDRKKAEQADARAEVKANRKDDVDVAGVLGQSEAPADPSEEKMRA